MDLPITTVSWIIHRRLELMKMTRSKLWMELMMRHPQHQSHYAKVLDGKVIPSVDECKEIAKLLKMDEAAFVRVRVLESELVQARLAVVPFNKPVRVK
jgi:hypothetical protein